MGEFETGARTGVGLYVADKYDAALLSHLENRLSTDDPVEVGRSERDIGFTLNRGGSLDTSSPFHQELIHKIEHATGAEYTEDPLVWVNRSLTSLVKQFQTKNDEDGGYKIGREAGASYIAKGVVHTKRAIGMERDESGLYMTEGQFAIKAFERACGILRGERTSRISAELRGGELIDQYKINLFGPYAVASALYGSKKLAFALSMKQLYYGALFSESKRLPYSDMEKTIPEVARARTRDLLEGGGVGALAVVSTLPKSRSAALKLADRLV